MKVKIIGNGVSGKAAESFLTQRGIETVVVADANEKVGDDFDFCVVSPGVPAEMVANEKSPIVAEVELPFYLDHHYLPRCLVAVTGTNGKTTIVNQITKLCEDAGKSVVLCGNVGTPVSRVADQLPNAIAVVEVSSFMLEQTKVLHPHIAVLTNITADHLDRHQTFAEYIRCKKQIAAQMTRKDYLIVNWDDVHAREVGLALKRARQCRVIWYSTLEKVKGYFVHRGYVYEAIHGWQRKLFAVNDLGGMPHTVSNALAVVAVGRRLHIKIPTMIAACKYHEQKHRLELVADCNGVVFYNDSKATNIASTLAATRAFTLQITLILCGQSKGQDYHELLENLPANVQHVIVFGAIKNQICTVATELQINCVEAVDDLTAAVQRASELTVRPGVVLFSPAGSSFDQFENYAARGEKFCAAVNHLLHQAPQCWRPTDVDL